MNIDSFFNLTKFLFTLLLFASYPLFSQSITLSEAVRMAENNNPKIMQYRERSLQKRDQKLEAWGNFLPKLYLDASYNHLNDPLEIDLNPIREVITTLQAKNQVEYANIYSLIGGRGALTSDQRLAAYISAKNALDASIPAFKEELKRQDNKYLTLTAVQPLFTGGKLLAVKNAAESEENAAQAEEEMISDEVCRDVIHAYINLSLMQDVIRVRRQALSSIRQHCYRAEKLFEAGMIPRYQLIRAQAAVSDAEQNLLDDSVKCNIAGQWLSNLTGSGEAILTASDSLIYIEYGSDKDSLTSAVVRHSPALRMLNEKKGTAGSAAEVQRANFLPVVSAFGKYEALPEYLSALEPRWTVGVRMQYNMFNGLTDYMKYSSARKVEEEMNCVIDDTQKKLRFGAEKSYQESEASIKRYKNLALSSAMAEENLRVAEKRFAAGNGTSLEVIDANTLLEKNKLDRVSALASYYKAMADLSNLAGNTNNFLSFWNRGNN